MIFADARFLGWHVGRTKLARKMFSRHKFSPEPFVFDGSEKISRKIPAKFRSKKSRKIHQRASAGARGKNRFSPFLHAQYDWTTGAPDNGNEWRKFRVVPRSHPLFVHCFSGDRYRRVFRLPGIISIVRWNLRPVIFGVDFQPNLSIWETQILAENRRFSQETAANWRLAFVPLGFSP